MISLILGVGLGWMTAVVALLWWFLLGDQRRADTAAAEREYVAHLPAATVITIDQITPMDAGAALTDGIIIGDTVLLPPTPEQVRWN